MERKKKNEPERKNEEKNQKASVKKNRLVDFKEKLGWQ
jgi:hypothetical protein